MSNANQPHPHSPGITGDCLLYRYPDYKPCDRPPADPIHTGTRATPDDLKFPYPPCSLCGEDTYHDGDGFRCDDCGAYWSNTGTGGQWDEDDAPACTVTHKPFDRPDLVPEHESIRHHVTYCRLPGNDGHDTHRSYDDLTTWTTP